MGQKWCDFFNVPQPRMVAYQRSLITLSTLIIVEELQTAIGLHGKSPEGKTWGNIKCVWIQEETNTGNSYLLSACLEPGSLPRLSSPTSLSAYGGFSICPPEL